MGIKPQFSKADISKMFQQRLKSIDEAIINRLILIGEDFVKNARENGNYNDVTGNLRSSIGYVVLRNGKVVNENFEESGNGNDKSKGITTAKKYIAELKSKFKSGYALIVVAGMDYAAAVESRGKDVLTSSGVKAEADLKKAMARIASKIK